ncbi:MAG TPA: lipopolysaccharide assembly protein LapA domain-containing protein [Jatrophihabitans sp.]|nr:lipopolysaccharide assembly protein LapA domain-containing protein [Jatrophihabitans sp.]
MTDPIDPPQPPAQDQPAPVQPGAGRLDEPARQAFGRTAPDPGPGTGSDAVPASGAPAPGFDERGRVKSGRISAVWVGLIGTAVFVILLIVFIAQNSHKASLHFLGWHGQFSLALTILLSAVVGMVLVAIPGSVRIAQLRRALRKNGPGRS